MVGRELHFETVGTLSPWDRHHTGVVHQDIETVVPELVRELPYGRKARDIQRCFLDVCIRHVFADPRRGVRATLRIATGEDDVAALAGQTERDVATEA